MLMPPMVGYGYFLESPNVLFDFRTPRRHGVDGKVLLRSLHVLMLCVCSTTLVSFLCVRFNSTATGHFCGKKFKPQRSSKNLFSLQT